MKNINRRQFFGKSMLALGSATLLAQLPIEGRSETLKPVKHPLGFQVYTIRG